MIQKEANCEAEGSEYEFFEVQDRRAGEEKFCACFH